MKEIFETNDALNNVVEENVNAIRNEYKFKVLTEDVVCHQRINN
jgi:hypothetical protein